MILQRLSLTAVLAAAALVAAAPAHATSKQFTVSFAGTGTYRSDYSTTTSRDFQGQDGQTYTGSCIDYRHEQTDLAWSAPYKIALGFNRRGRVSGATDSASAVAPGHLPESQVTNDTRPGSDGDGCTEPSTGQTSAGNADCVGHTMPAGSQRLHVSAAPANGRTSLAIEGPRFEGADFGGQWSYHSGSCAQNNNGRTLGLPDGPSFPIVLAVAFPVQTKRWATLPRGHYFRVKVKPGHYAADGLLPIQCSAGCVRKLDWHGEVRVRRVK